MSPALEVISHFQGLAFLTLFSFTIFAFYRVFTLLTKNKYASWASSTKNDANVNLLALPTFGSRTMNIQAGNSIVFQLSRSLSLDYFDFTASLFHYSGFYSFFKGYTSLSLQPLMVYPKPLPKVPNETLSNSRHIKTPKSSGPLKSIVLKAFSISVKSKFKTNYKSSRKSSFRRSLSFLKPKKCTNYSPFIGLYNRKITKSTSLNTLFDNSYADFNSKPKNSISVGWLHKNDHCFPQNIHPSQNDLPDNDEDDFSNNFFDFSTTLDQNSTNDEFSLLDSSKSSSSSNVCTDNVVSTYSNKPPKRVLNDVQQQLIFNIYSKYYPIS
ncbi:hypothetical protein AYI69_g11070 [Smittium culicis]|uniref:Uncharacterized protein n=1 Tax=Smittium culicis TaxID=133412 RepID=A0A1R1X1C0_9FUNG|nr:hypothetical protein AYI69_g11070 [Smittium culicis]